jgi:hypothetical protein
VDDVTFTAFRDELCKIAGWKDLWNKFTDFFRTQDARVNRRVDYHFSPQAGPDKWNKFIRNVEDPEFVNKIVRHPDADAKLIQHAKSMHDLTQGKTVGVIKSSRLPGKTYEIRKVPGGLACTCPDWRFKGSINPGYECKHIKAYQEGKKVADD